MADARILAQLSDMVGFVVRWNEPQRDVVLAALRRLGSDRVAGVALNAFDAAKVAQYGQTYEQYLQTRVKPAQIRHGAFF